MPRTRLNYIEFYNFVCRFGEDQGLIDQAENIVLPALMSQEPRKYAGTSWFLLDPALVNLGDGNIGLVFDFVKDATLERDLVLRQKVLKRDFSSMERASAAYVLLVLNNHRLVYYPRTRFAPHINELAATTAHLIRTRRAAWINEQVAARDPGYGETRKVREQLHDEVPYPQVEIVPLAGASQIQSAMSRFKTIESFTVTMVDTNNELDLDDFFRQMRDSRDRLGADRSSLKHASSTGLVKSAIEKEVRAAATQGTARIRLKGVDKDGTALTQTNDDVIVRVEADFEEESPKENAKDLFAALARVTASGIVKAQRLKADAKEKIAAIVARLLRKT